MKMKIKYRHSKDRGEWSRHEKKAVSIWNRSCLALALILVVCTVIGWNVRQIDLGDPQPEGFVLWFMLCCAYPVLGLLGLINSLLGTQDSTVMHFLTRDHQVIGLALINGATLLLLWLFGRFMALRWIGAASLRISANFLLILVGWGVFQLFLYGTVTVWSTGGFQPLHANLRKEEPDRVIVVGSEEAEMPAESPSEPKNPIGTE